MCGYSGSRTFYCLGDKIMWIVILIVILIVLSTISKSGPSPEQIDRKRQETQQRCEELTKDIAAVIDEYSNTANHSADETRMAWEKCNKLFETCGVQKAGAVFQIFYEVCPWLTSKVAMSMSKYDGAELRTFSNAFAEKLLDFYYRVAFTFDLAPDDQAGLIHYLRYFLCGPTEYILPYATQSQPSAVSYQRSLELDIDRADWDVKCLALYEEGSQKNSPLAMRCLADCHYKKIGVDLKDYDKAFSLYQQAAKLGDMRALYMLGQCYENSRGTIKNYQKAGDCYQYAYDVSRSQCPESAIVQDCAKALNRLNDDNRWVKSRYSPDIFDCSNTPVMKKSNLAKLKQDVDKCLHIDLDTADLSILAVSIGRINEQIIKSFIECYESAYIKRDPSQQIEILRQRGYFTKEMFEQTTVVRKLRNRGAHNEDGEPITLEEIKQAMRYIKNIVEYYEQF